MLEPERVAVPVDARDLRGPFRHRRTIEVRFADTDAMGHVNNAKYLTYVETARTKYIEEVILGEPMRLGAYGEFSFIVADVRLAYRSPAHYGETLTVETRTSRVGRTSLRMDHRITAPDSAVGKARLIAICESVLVRYDYESESPVPVSEAEIDRIEAFEGRSLRETR
jgi:acyl-CoA thioester hydrolase